MIQMQRHQVAERCSTDGSLRNVILTEQGALTEMVAYSQQS